MLTVGERRESESRLVLFQILVSNFMSHFEGSVFARTGHRDWTGMEPSKARWTRVQARAAACSFLYFSARLCQT